MSFVQNGQLAGQAEQAFVGFLFVDLLGLERVVYYLY
jgi:hypothetical protein